MEDVPQTKEPGLIAFTRAISVWGLFEKHMFLWWKTIEQNNMLKLE